MHDRAASHERPSAPLLLRCLLQWKTPRRFRGQSSRPVCFCLGLFSAQEECAAGFDPNVSGIYTPVSATAAHQSERVSGTRWPTFGVCGRRFSKQQQLESFVFTRWFYIQYIHIDTSSITIFTFTLCLKAYFVFMPLFHTSRLLVTLFLQFFFFFFNFHFYWLDCYFDRVKQCFFCTRTTIGALGTISNIFVIDTGSFVFRKPVANWHDTHKKHAICNILTGLRHTR